MRLIYAELAKAQFTGNFAPTYTTAEVHAFIDSVPTVDAVEVVRCANCEDFSVECSKYCDNYRYVCRRFRHKVYPNDFCSYGEKVK